MSQPTPVFGVVDSAFPRKLRNCVYVVIKNESGLVATVTDSGKLFLPGGGIEEGETPAQAARREILEELGSELTLGEFICTAVQHFVFDQHSYEVHSMFFTGVLGERVIPLHEHILIWSSPEELFHASQSWAARNVLRKSGNSI